MDSITFELIVRKLQQLCSRPKEFPWVKSITKDPDSEHGLVYNTQCGEARGKVWQEGGNFVFRIGKRELLIPIEEFLGRLQ